MSSLYFSNDSVDQAHLAELAAHRAAQHAKELAQHIPQQVNTAICPLGEVKEDCPGYGAVGERACVSCNENAVKQQ